MSAEILVREAHREDLEQIVSLLKDDEIACQRESSQENLLYRKAFSEIENDDNNYIFVAELDRKVCACFQLTLIRCLTYSGGKRLLVEGVRVSKNHRGAGLGKRIFEWIKGYAIENGCHMVQLTTDRKRPEALKFYESVGYVNSHNGMKLHL